MGALVQGSSWQYYMGAYCPNDIIFSKTLGRLPYREELRCENGREERAKRGGRRTVSCSMLDTRLA